MASRSKIISAKIALEDINSYSFFDTVISNVQDETAIKDEVINKLQSDVGILDAFVEENQIVLQWFPENTDEEAEKFHQEATLFAKQKKYDLAIESWKKANNLNPNDVEYLYKIGLVLFEKKSYLEAITYLEKAANICKIHSRAYLILGMCWIKLRKFEKAEGAIQQSLLLNNDNLLSYLNLGAVFTVRKKFQEAIDVFNHALKKYPNEVRAYLGLAKVYSAQSENQLANENYKKVLELAPDSSMAEYAKKSIREIHSNLEDVVVDKEHQSDETCLTQGFHAFIQNNHQEASDHYKTYLKNKPSDDYVWYLYGETKLRSGQIDEAVDCFKRSLRLNDKRGLYYKMLGISLYYSGKGEECLQVLKKANELGKDDSVTKTLLGICYLQKKQYDLATNFLKDAIKQFNNNYLAIYNLAMTNVKKENKDQAVELLTNILSKKIEMPILNASKKLIKALRE